MFRTCSGSLATRNARSGMLAAVMSVRLGERGDHERGDLVLEISHAGRLRPRWWCAVRVGGGRRGRGCRSRSSTRSGRSGGRGGTCRNWVRDSVVAGWRRAGDEGQGSRTRTASVVPPVSVWMRLPARSRCSVTGAAAARSLRAVRIRLDGDLDVGGVAVVLRRRRHGVVASRHEGAVNDGDLIRRPPLDRGQMRAVSPDCR